MIVFYPDADDSMSAAAENAPSPSPETTTSASETAVQEKPELSKYEQLRRSRKTITGTVLGWANNGLEVKLDDGVIASMPDNHIDLVADRNIADYFGKPVEVRVLDTRMEKGAEHVRVSHRMVIEEGLRKAAKDVLETMNIGDVIDVKVKSFSIKDVVIDLGPGIEAIIFGKDLSWERFDHPYELVKRGQTIQAKIVELDKRKRYVRFGVKQLTPDPLQEKYSAIKEGDIVKATVTSIVDQGAEVELESGIIAFLPVSEIAWERITSVSDAIEVGEEFEVQLLTIEPKRHRVTCSKKRLIENPIRQREENYKVGTDHDATIKEITKGGLVVAFADGNEGFVPRRELSHDRIERLEDSFKKDKPLEGLRVIEYDRRNGKITLSLIAAEKEAQRTTMRQYRATSKGSSFQLGELGSLKEKLEQAERAG